MNKNSVKILKELSTKFQEVSTLLQELAESESENPTNDKPIDNKPTKATPSITSVNDPSGIIMGKQGRSYIFNKGFGSSEWYNLLHEIVGRFVTVKRGSRIDTLYQELSDNYPYLLDPEIINQEDQLLELIEFERKYRSLKTEWRYLNAECDRLCKSTAAGEAESSIHF